MVIDFADVAVRMQLRQLDKNKNLQIFIDL
jgi:hypothetical protein